MSVLVYRLEQRESGLGPYRVRRRDDDGNEWPIISDAGWRHRPMPREDPGLVAVLGAGDRWWAEGWCSAFAAPEDVGRWFETAWERAALEEAGFVVRGYAVGGPEEMIRGQAQVLVRPTVLVPERRRGEWAVAEIWAGARVDPLARQGRRRG